MYALPPSNKVAQKMIEIFLRELSDLRRKPKLSREELKNMRRLRQALTITGTKR